MKQLARVIVACYLCWSLNANAQHANKFQESVDRVDVNSSLDEQLRQLEIARKHLRAAKKSDEEVSLSKFVEYCQKQARRYDKQGNYTESAKYYMEAVSGLEKFDVKDKKLCYLVLYGAEAFRKCNRPIKAINLCRVARLHLEQIEGHDTPELGLAYIQEARINISRNEANIAWINFQMALESCSKHPNSRASDLVRKQVFELCAMAFPGENNMHEHILRRLQELIRIQERYTDDRLLQMMKNRLEKIETSSELATKL